MHRLTWRVATVVGSAVLGTAMACGRPVERGTGGSPPEAGSAPSSESSQAAPASLHALLQQLAAKDGVRLIDLTHPLSAESLYWPTGSPFEHRRLAWGANDQGLWYAAAAFSSPEHLGTHLDAPIHFAQDGWTTTDIPVDRLIAAVAVIDISAKAEANTDATLEPADVAVWEEEHGTLPSGAIAVIRTGWSSRWPDWERYYGSETPKDATTLHFPGISEAAAELLAERGVVGVGIDTASLDPGPSTRFEAHRALAAAGIFGLENLSNLEAMPATGALIIALPMKIQDGTGGPTRVLALVPLR